MGGEGSKSSEAASPAGGKRKRHLLDFTLAGLPELEHFETAQQRAAALEEIGREAGDLGRGGYWLAIAALVVAVVAVQWAMRWLLAKTAWVKWVEDVLILLVTGGAFFVVLRALHRRGAAAELRQKLLRQGVPVCVQCGYLLRGLPLDPGRCPECGRAFEDRVRGILSASVRQDGPRSG